MSESLTLNEIKSRWNEVLDQLLHRDRIAWLSFFDARLASYANDVLTLDFQDSGKFATEHDFSTVRKSEKLEILEEIVQNILHTSLSIAIQ